MLIPNDDHSYDKRARCMILFVKMFYSTVYSIHVSNWTDGGQHTCTNKHHGDMGQM